MRRTRDIINKTIREFTSYWFTIAVIFILIMLDSCKKLVSIPEPVNSLTTAETFTTETNATDAINAIYSNMSWYQNSISYSNGGATLYTALSSDELVPYTNPNSPFYKVNLFTDNGDVAFTFWNAAFFHIYMANAAIEGLQNSATLTKTVKDQLTGEAKFLRAFGYFYLVNFFGDVPLMTSTAFAKNSVLPRAPAASVYDLIVSDLKDARQLLKDDYAISGGERVRANKWTAAALLARVYLYRKDWANAALQATDVIDNSALYHLADLASSFLKNNPEAIFQLQLINGGSYATNDGKQLIPSLLIKDFPPEVVQQNPTFFIPDYYVSPSLASAFEPDDQRKYVWLDSTGSLEGTNYYYVRKFRVKQGTADNITEYYTPLRLAEQYLIRAEAKANLNEDITGAIQDINTIRERAGLTDIPALLGQSELLNAVAQENRIEFLVEYGHRWLDLKRTGQADAVLSIVKGANWQSTDQLYPVPLSEIRKDPNLTQNPGYQ
jgi:hypothetical protein